MAFRLGRSGTTATDIEKETNGVRVAAEPGCCSAPYTRELHTYWSDIRGNRRVPCATDFDIIANPGLLPYLVIMDVENENRDFKVRFSGSGIANLIGVDITGEAVQDLQVKYNSVDTVAPLFNNSRTILSKCLSDRLPVLNGPRHLSRVRGNHSQFESLTVPFEDGEGAVSMVVTVFDIRRLTSG